MNLRPIRIEGDLAFIPLTKGYEAVIDAVDAWLVAGCDWYALVAPHTVYAIRRAKKSEETPGRTIYMHRVLMNAADGVETDHISCDGLDNRRSNLRLATASQNQHNKRAPKNNTSGLKGVSWHSRSRKWRARICLNKKTKHLGEFDSREEAFAVYASACSMLHGEFGRVA